MRKKILALMLTISLLIFSACGSSKKTEPPSKPEAGGSVEVEQQDDSGVTEPEQGSSEYEYTLPEDEL